MADAVPGRVLYDLEPVNEYCMPLKKGNVITITFRTNDSQWWFGKLDEVHG